MVFYDDGPGEENHFFGDVGGEIGHALERFLGILIEHFGGAFPVWLAPVQVMLVPVGDRFNDYAKSVRDRLFAEGIRVEADLSDETMRYKIRAAQSQQVPYMLVVGERESSEGAVSVRHRRRGDGGATSVDVFLAQIRAEIDAKTLDS